MVEVYEKTPVIVLAQGEVVVMYTEALIIKQDNGICALSLKLGTTNTKISGKGFGCTFYLGTTEKSKMKLNKENGAKFIETLIKFPEYSNYRIFASNISFNYLNCCLVSY